MKLSILIPMYNAQDFIGRCLDSLVRQDLTKDEYEILIMDDGSTDKSVETVQAYTKQHEFIHLFTKVNEGAYTTRNKLLQLAQGEYIYNVDADDYIQPYTLQLLLKAGREKSVDLLGFKTSVTKSTTLTDKFYQDEIKDIPNVISGPEFLERYKNFRVEVWWYLIRREFLEANRLLFSNNQYNADVIFTINCYLKAEKVLFFTQVIYFYYQSPYSIMRNTERGKILKRLEYSYDMIIDFSILINKFIASTSLKEKENILNNLSFRRDTFLFFLIIRILRTKFKSQKLNFYIETLTEVNAYPIKNFMCKEHNRLTYKILLFLINKPNLLKFINRLSNFKQL